MDKYKISIDKIRLREDKLIFIISINAHVKYKQLSFKFNDFDEILEGEITSTRNLNTYIKNTLTVEFFLTDRFKQFKDGMLKTTILADGVEKDYYNAVYALNYTDVYYGSIDDIKPYFSEIEEKYEEVKDYQLYDEELDLDLDYEELEDDLDLELDYEELEDDLDLDLDYEELEDDLDLDLDYEELEDDLDLDLDYEELEDDLDLDLDYEELEDDLDLDLDYEELEDDLDDYELDKYNSVYSFDEKINIFLNKTSGVELKIVKFKKIGNDWLGINIEAENRSNKIRELSLIGLSSGEKKSIYVGELPTKQKVTFEHLWIKGLDFTSCPELSFYIYLAGENSDDLEYVNHVRTYIDEKNSKIGFDLFFKKYFNDYDFKGRKGFSKTFEIKGYDRSWFDIAPYKFELEISEKNNGDSTTKDETLDFNFNFIVKESFGANILSDFEVYITKPNGRKVKPWGYRADVGETPTTIDIWSSTENYIIEMCPVFEMKEIGSISKDTRISIVFKDTLQKYIVRKTYVFDEVWYDEEMLALPF